MDLSQAHTVLEEEAGARKGLSTSRLEKASAFGRRAPVLRRETRKVALYKNGKWKKLNDHRRGRTCNLLIRSQTRCHFARRPRNILSPYANIMGNRDGRCRKYRKRPLTRERACWQLESKSDSSVIHHNVLASLFSPSTFYCFWQVLKLSTRLILALSLAEPSKQSILLSAPFLALSGCHTQPHQVEAKRHPQALNRPCKRLKGL
jgi:hypothetical protein